MNTHKPIALLQSKEPKFLDIKFNQDQGCFAIGHEYGFHVYNTDPIDSRVERNFRKPSSTAATATAAAAASASASSNGFISSGSGIGHITMLHRTNYLALVGGGKHPKFSNNKLVIWDDLKRKTSLTLEFLSPVLNVLLSRIRIIVVLQNQVLVYGFSSPPKKFATYETISNELGLADLSVNSTSFSQPVGPSTSASSSASILSSSSTATNTGVTGGSASKNTSSASSLKSQKPYRDKYQILAFPGRSPGQIQLVDVSPTGQEKNLVSIIKAHKSKIRCLALNRLGTLVASASETGTIIRVHSTYNTALLYEFRRGLDRAIITSMKFSQNDSKLAVLSDKNTLHIFNVTSDPNQEHSTAATMHDIMDAPILPSHPINRQHLLRNLPIPVPNYFKSTWSFCSVNINKYHNEILSDAVVDDEPNIGVLGWSGNDSIVIVWKNKRIWEKYVIVEKSRQTGENEVQWEIIRDSWKSLDVD